MQSYIYRSEKKIDCYLFLQKQEKDFELPDVVKKVVGALHFVMEIDITPDTKLAFSEPDKVLTAMEEQGFYIQMPPSKPHPVDQLFERLFDEESS